MTSVYGYARICQYSGWGDDDLVLVVRRSLCVFHKKLTCWWIPGGHGGSWVIGPIVDLTAPTINYCSNNQPLSLTALTTNYHPPLLLLSQPPWPLLSSTCIWLMMVQDRLLIVHLHNQANDSFITTIPLPKVGYFETLSPVNYWLCIRASAPHPLGAGWGVFKRSPHAPHHLGGMSKHHQYWEQKTTW